MKYKITIAFLAIILVTVFTACKKYLDVTPDDIGTIDYAFRSRSQAEKYLFTCYNNLPKYGALSQDPGFFTGDEFVGPYPNGIGLPIHFYQIARGEQGIVNPIANFWDGNNGGRPLFKAMRECNIFLEGIEKVPDINAREKKRWIAEVKFLKAYFHFFLMRMYGPIPIMNENIPVSSSIDDVRVYRKPIDSVVNYVVNLLDQAAPDLPPIISNEASEFGRITKPIALSVKAQILATAASPLFNGNSDFSNFKNKNGEQLFPSTYSVEKWAKAAEACKAAIDAAESEGAALYYYLNQPGEKISDSTKITMNIRGSLADKWNEETIWGASNSSSTDVEPFCQARLISGNTSRVPTPPTTNESIRSMLAPPIHIAEMFYSNKGVPIDEDKTYDYINRHSRLRIAEDVDKFYLYKGYTTVQLNFDREPRYYADLGFDGCVWFGHGLYDDASTWHMEAKAGQLGAKIGASNYSVTGYLPKKLVNYKNEFGSNSGGYIMQGYPWPVIRLAEIYLLYAEALNEQGGPSAEAYKYINMVRERAGLNGVVESWAAYSTKPSKPTTKDGLRSIIHQETMIEVVFEGKRFWDLRRWKRASEYFNIPITGWNIEQETASNYYRPRQIFTPTFFNKDYLWPISEHSLNVNPNLVQNPGW